MAAKSHQTNFGEKPALKGLVRTDWPVVLTAQPIGINQVVTRYFIQEDGEVSLKRQ